LIESVADTPMKTTTPLAKVLAGIFRFLDVVSSVYEREMS